MLEKGFHATSIEEIIGCGGNNQERFFYHFPDKAALAREMQEPLSGK